MARIQKLTKIGGAESTGLVTSEALQMDKVCIGQILRALLAKNDQVIHLAHI